METLLNTKPVGTRSTASHFFVRVVRDAVERVPTRFMGISLLVAFGLSSWSLFGQEVAGDPEDEFSPPDAPGALADPVSQLQKRLANGTAKLKFEPHRGYLTSLLETLNVPVSSQALVFSKTSSQRDHTSPQTPRAIYFADDVSVGFAPGAPVIDVAAVDPKWGPIFYTLDQKPELPPRFTRRSDCRQCHLGPKTLYVPGLLVRSVYTASDGTPLAQVDGFVNGHKSPLEQRWGGWYVTGTHAGAMHLGNLCATNKDHPERLELSSGANVTNLCARFDTSPYPSRHSDLLALLVLEHQVRMQNLLTRASLQTCAAPEQTTADGEMLLEYMLFRDEAPLKGPVSGTSTFATEFELRGPRDSKGRSLRQFDLQSRLFRYPCSFMIYSAAFDSLPQAMKRYLWGRLEQILTGKDMSPAYATLKTGERQALLEILRETKPEFAASLGK